ncbi:MAG TPA: 16S rRNA (uracil(1498)-N(3))-methyltransferase [Streptosporangiaceae bacterium]|nr:16S rRNA (uracil(1498)-N(3))-methyltransferase [Streptosporangiaceae bacterium]
MTPPVFICDRASLETDRVTLAGPEGRHATVVRRLAVGEPVDLTDGNGLVAHCVVVAARTGELDLAVRARRIEPAPRHRVVVVQAILKGDRGELAVELMTEVGVDVIVPWAAERCVARWSSDRAGKALTRLRSTAREAAKQSRRARFPEVTDQADLAQVAARVSRAQLALLLDPAAESRLADAELPADAGPADGDIVLIVGPEGGVSETETKRLVQAGAVPARLGPSVLRASTAGAIASTLILTATGRWP